MISQAGWWTRTPSATPLQPKEWNPNFWNTFNFSCLAGLVDGLKLHLPPILLQPKKWNAHFWNMFNFWWSAWLVNGLEPHLPPLSSQKNEMLIFGLHSTSDDRPGWSMDLNPIYHLSPATKMKCSFLDYVQLLMISWIGQWTWTPSTTPLQPKTWNACFWITFNFWWSARLVDGLEPHLQPLSSRKKWNAHFWIMFNFWWSAQGWSMDSNPICHLSPAKKWNASFLDYVQLLMISPAGQWTQTPSATSLQPKKWNVHFWITFNFWWLARLVDGLEPHPPPISSQKNEMLIFGLCSTSDDQPGWSMDSNPICHPSPAKNMKCSFLDYIQLLMFSWIGPHPPPFSSQKKLNAHFKIMFSFWRSGLVNGLKPHLPPLSKKNEMLVFGLPFFLMIGPAGPRTPAATPSDDHFWSQLLMWSMDLNPICHPSAAKNMKCSFLDYIQLPMIGQAGQWTQTPSATLSSKKMKCLFLDYLQLLMIGRAGRWTWTPSTTSLQPKKWNAHFWITFNFWWSAGLVNGLEPHLPPISSQKHEMLVFG